jgi:hypothetical protein
MASLNLSNQEILQAIATVAGISRELDWDDSTKQDVWTIIRSGLRRFYSADGEHQWSFMERKFYAAYSAPYSTGTVAVTGGVVTLSGGTWPTWAKDGVLVTGGTTLFITDREDNTHLSALSNTGVVVTAGSSYVIYRWRYPLPDDFGEFLDRVSYNHPTYGRLLRSTTEAEIRLRWVATFQTGQTCMYAIVPGNTSVAVDDGGDPSRWYFHFWPTFDANAAVAAEYRAVPLDQITSATDLLTDADTIIQADAVHAETMLAAILAATEEFYNDQPGVHSARYASALQTSIMLDRRSQGRRDFSGGNDTRGQEFYLTNHVPTYTTIP